MNESMIEDGLQRIAGSVEVPAVAPGADLARGRRRLLRQRAGIAGASLAVAGLLGGAALLAPGDDGRSDREPEVLATDPAPPPPSASPSASPSPSTEEGIGVDREEANPEDWKPANLATLQTWTDVLAEHLDPAGGHLQTTPTGEHIGGDGMDVHYLGTKLGWTQPGQSGLGLVEIGVAESAAALDGSWACSRLPYEDGWECGEAQVDPTTGHRYWVGTKGDLTQVVVEKDGKTWVLLSINPLFGNNSLTPVTGLAFETADLVGAASDPRLVLPAKIEQSERLDQLERQG